ncbi:MAG: hypothetical protein RO009_02270 [Pseudorhodoplanes sp.]|jgi:hypothetical protein|nr:hypothetical protein [Pseudorhodoplanes sp.]
MRRTIIFLLGFLAGGACVALVGPAYTQSATSKAPLFVNMTPG